MSDENSHRFSSGLELASLIAASDLLEHSWKAITEQRSKIRANGFRFSAFFGRYSGRSNCEIIAFVTAPNRNPVRDLVSFSDLKDEFPAFEFLCSKQCPDFAINGVALEFFRNFYDVYEQEIVRLQSNPKTQLIITGHALGGSVASLFTLLLLDLLDLTKAKRPLCITFGSPLLGDNALQNAISQFSAWSSCFLHVVSNHDPLPRMFLNHTVAPYCPFGTFLFCSESDGCAASADPTSVSSLLEATAVPNVPSASHSQLFDYKETVDRLINLANLKAVSELITENSETLRGSIVAQIEAIGVVKNQAQRQQNKLALVMRTGETDAILKTKTSDASEALNVIKIIMAKLEWYKKVCQSEDIGYYDAYKNSRLPRDISVAEFKKDLRDYWERMVEEVEQRPQREGAPFNVRWMFGGTNYRRMVEPLDIAEHYRKGLRDYKSHRPKHYKKLEEWFENLACDPSTTQKEAVSSILTVDSCFWANVEEAILACQVVKMVDCSAQEEEEAMGKLKDFEDYVVRLIRNCAVSSEIFLPKSSFMSWWEEYDEIVGHEHDSVLTTLMRNQTYEQYANGRLDIP